MTREATTPVRCLAAATRTWLVPIRVLSLRAANKAWRVIVALFRRLLPRSVTSFYADLRRASLSEGDLTQATIHSTAEVRISGYEWRPLPEHTPGAFQTPVTLVALATGQGDEASWLHGILAQTRLPDEVIIVNAAVTDKLSAAVLRDFGGTTQPPIRVVHGGDAGSGHAWNVGIAEASHAVVACTGLDCKPDPRWLERLTSPFEVDEGIGVAAGSWEPATTSLLAKSLAAALPGSDWAAGNWCAPRSKSLAFRKGAWVLVGGYPEWSTHPAEETYFALALRRACPRWALVPEAAVRSCDSLTAAGVLSAAQQRSFAEGESALRAEEHRRLLTGSAQRALVFAAACVGLGFAFLFPWLAALPAAALLLTAGALGRDVARRRPVTGIGLPAIVGLRALAGVVAPAVALARLVGFVRGVRHRPRVFERRSGEISGIIFLLSLMPTSDSGGGQRPAQLAREFLRRGYLVVFVNKWESNEIGGLRTDIHDPLLMTYAEAVFDPDRFLTKHENLVRDKPLLTIVEAPVPAFLRVARRLRNAGATVIYEIIDDWNTGLGSGFYSAAEEDSVIDASDVLTATARPLMKHVEEAHARPVALLPNAVNTEIFDRRKLYRRPSDMPPGEFTACYVGALWGSWFDWDLLRAVALSYPAASIVVIGDYRGQCPDPAANLHFLGLKPQGELPAYLTHSDLCIIPWTLNKITESTSPLKLYEYLAMGKPVVAPRIKELEGLPYVLLSRDREEFVANIEKARRVTVDDAAIDAFISANDWAHRVSVLLELAEMARSERQAGQAASKAGRS